METKLMIKDFLTFEETDEDDGSGFPIISVRFLGVEVERSVVRMWGTDKQDQGEEDYVEKAADVIRAFWNQAGEKS